MLSADNDDHDNDNDNISDAGGSDVEDAPLLAQNMTLAMLAAVRAAEVFSIPLDQYHRGVCRLYFHQPIFPLLSGDYGQEGEVDAYADVAAALSRAFEMWHFWQRSNRVRERELCMTLRGDGQQFGEHCTSLPLLSIGLEIADTAAEPMRAQG